jgi:hypothetical protein
MRAFTLMIVATFAIGAEALAEDCKQSITGLDSYERELKQAIRDEPEDLPKELQRYAKALGSGDSAQADRLQRKVRAGYAELKMIASPPSLAQLHADLIDYYRAGVAVLDALDSGDDRARRNAELETWLGLKRFFLNLRALSIEHRCNEGDLEALDQHYLPEIEKRIEQMRSGQDPPDRD